MLIVTMRKRIRYSGCLLRRIWPLHAPILILDGHHPQHPQRRHHPHHLHRRHQDQLEKREGFLEGRGEDHRHLLLWRLPDRLHPCSRLFGSSCFPACPGWTRYVMVCIITMIIDQDDQLSLSYEHQDHVGCTVFCIIIIISIFVIFPRFSAPTFLLVLYAAPSAALLLLTEAIFFRRFLKKYPAELLLNFHLHSQVSRNLSTN